jgi:esterase
MKLFHRRYGQEGNQPLVVLHGLFGLSDNWDTLARRFAEAGYDVIVPDMRNHGRSGHSETMSYEAMSDDLLELLDGLGLQASHLLGHSMGGKAAMQFAFDYPERIDKLIIADISPEASGNRVHDQLIEMMCSAELEKRTSRKEVEVYLAEKVPSERIRLFLLKNVYWKDKSTLGWRMNLKVIRNSLDEIFRGIDAPWPYGGSVLFLRGEQSDYITDESTPLIHDMFPGAELRIIKNGTHWLHADNPDDFAREVLAFLK